MRRFNTLPLMGAGLVCLVAGIVPASICTAQENLRTPRGLESAQATEQLEDAEDLSRSARRILHFTGGGVARGVARFIDGQWELKAGSGWQTFAQSAISSSPRESDVLREQKRRDKAAKKTGDIRDRVGLAEWMVDAGLLIEALTEIDLVLDESPHHPAALSLLASRRLIAVPSLEGETGQDAGARKNLFTWATKAPRAARELAIIELRKVSDREALHAELLAGLGNFSLRRRSFSAHAIGRLYPGDDAKRMLQHAVLDASAEVRREAAQALHNADDPSLIVPVVRALSSANPRVRMQAAEALGYMAYPAAVEPLIGYITAAVQSGGGTRAPHGYIFVGKQTAYIQDFDVEVATFQAVADPQINVLLEGDVLEAGVSGVVEYSLAAESRAARGSLSRLTGADGGNTARSWMRWWEANRNDWAVREE